MLTVFRSTTLLPLLLGLAVVAGCGDSSAEPPPPPAFGAAPAGTVGRVVANVGPHRVEIEPHRTGEIYVYPAPTLLAPAAATMNVIVPVTGGSRTTRLRWNDDAHRYEGRVTGATILPGPVTVTVLTGGMTFVGVATVVVLAPAITVVVDTYHGKHKYRGHHGRRGRFH